MRTRPALRTFLAVGVSVVVAAACTGGDPGDGSDGAAAHQPSRPSPRSIEAACGLPPEHLERIRRGYHPDRSGDLQIVPEEPDVVAEWLSHAGPWEYVQRVPLFFYGPGHVPAAGRIARPATVADVAPTLARLLDLDFDAPDGRPLSEAVAEDRPGPPRLILTLVWDSAGRNVLAEHPDAWPTLRSLISGGAWFDRATVGTSPSTTPAVHGTIGTGAFPRSHGLVDLRFRVEGSDELAWVGEERPGHLLLPTLADRYSASTDQAARVALIASLGTLGMIGHGASVEGGARHVVAYQEESRWTIGEGLRDAFRFPGYVNDVGGLEEAVRRLDLEDGRLDQTWLGERVLDDPTDLSFSPAFAEHQTRVVKEVVRREGLGGDEVTDLLFVNYKQIDTVGHRWTMNSPQMEAVVRSSDDALAQLIDLLDREVGRGEWVVALTADHGSVPDPDLSGGFVIDLPRLARELRAEFDADDDDGTVVRQARPTQLWLDVDRLARNGYSLDDVAAFLADITKERNAADPADMPEDDRDTPLFGAVFPSAALEADLPCPSEGP